MIAVRLSSPWNDGRLERLPHRALGHLRVAAQRPDPVRQAVEVLAGVGDANRDRQSLAQRSGGHVDPRQDGRRVALDPAAEPAEGEHLLVLDGAGRLVHGVQQRRGVALGEDQVVVARVVRRVEVVVQVLRSSGRPSGPPRTSTRSGGRSPRPSWTGSSRPAAAGRAHAIARARSCRCSSLRKFPAADVRQMIRGAGAGTAARLGSTGSINAAVWGLRPDRGDRCGRSG